jgi:hypothetical protein
MTMATQAGANVGQELVVPEQKSAMTLFYDTIRGAVRELRSTNSRSQIQGIADSLEHAVAEQESESTHDGWLLDVVKRLKAAMTIDEVQPIVEDLAHIEKHSHYGFNMAALKEERDRALQENRELSRRMQERQDKINQLQGMVDAALKGSAPPAQSPLALVEMDDRNAKLLDRIKALETQLAEETRLRQDARQVLAVSSSEAEESLRRENQILKQTITDLEASCTKLDQQNGALLHDAENWRTQNQRLRQTSMRWDSALEMATRVRIDESFELFIGSRDYNSVEATGNILADTIRDMAAEILKLRAARLDGQFAEVERDAENAPVAPTKPTGLDSYHQHLWDEAQEEIDLIAKSSPERAPLVLRYLEFQLALLPRKEGEAPF